MKKGLLLSLLLVSFIFISGCTIEEIQEAEESKQPIAEESEEIETQEEISDETEAIKEEPITLPVEPGSLVHDVKEPEIELFNPALTYPDAYNGPLYATSEQVGNSAPMGLYFEGMDRNGVNFIIGFFAVQDQPDENALISSEGLGYMIDAVQRHPNRITPFFSPGFSSSETKPLLGDKLTNTYKNNLEASKAIVGEGVIKGFGEIEQYAWSMQPNDPKLLQLYDVAKANKLYIMFHPDAGQSLSVKKLIEAYPDNTFFIHMFPEDFEKDRSSYIEIMKSHDKLYFSIDTDHMLYDGRTGLLYKYEDDSLNAAKSRFISDFDSNQKSLLQKALSRYKPLVDAVPDKVMWGNEMGPRYNYEPEVYDRMIKFARIFIGQLNIEHQENVAYKNALRVFGYGAKLDKEINIFDSSSWRVCTQSQLSDCDKACADTMEDTPESLNCHLKCTIEQQCIEPMEEN